MSIETHKRKKLFMGIEKGYGDKPELLPLNVLWDRMIEEFEELKEIMPIILEQYHNPVINFDYENYIKVKDEIADLSNFCSFIFDGILLETGFIKFEDIYGENENE